MRSSVASRANSGSPQILGLNAYHGDASAVLFRGGELVSAVEEERLRRIKHWAGFPLLAAKTCLAGADLDRLTDVAISRDPRAHLWSKIDYVVSHPGIGFRAVSRARNAFRAATLGRELQALGLRGVRGMRIHNVEHHRAHLASAFFASPFEEAAILSIDGFGDFSSMMWGVGRGNRLRIHGSVSFPHSLGLFYTAFTQFLGFHRYGDEYKLMGLAACGEPRYLKQIRPIVTVIGDQVRLDLTFFVHQAAGVSMTWNDQEPQIGLIFSEKMREVFGTPRKPCDKIEDHHADLAASVQAVLEECYFALLREVHLQTRLDRLCLAGGVALNCAANGKIIEQTGFRDVYIQPAANDAGTALGAALYVQHQLYDQPRSFVMRHVYYGPEYSDRETRSPLDDSGAVYQELREEALIAETARILAAGGIVGWFQGRMEFGPRALGNRSILADPRRIEMVETLNRRIKRRESFRPFCPSILAEAAADYFETAHPSPFMLHACRIRPSRRPLIPAVTHADGTGRLPDGGS